MRPAPRNSTVVRVTNSPDDGLTAAATRYVRRATQTARNVAEVVRFGGLETSEQPSPFTVEVEQATYRLRHYFPDDMPRDAAPVLLVHPLMLTAELWDVSTSASAVAELHAHGVDPWVVDFGRPEREPGGLQRNLTDHVLAVSDAVERVHKSTGRPVLLGGYSQGGMFVYQAAALRRGKDIDSLITFGSPADTTAPLPIPLAPEVLARTAGELVESGILRKVALPGWAARLGFKMLTPAKSVQQRVQFLLALNDREALLPRERQRRFLDSEGWTAYSGPAIAELLDQFIRHNRMLEGGFVIDDRLVTLADIDLPLLTFVGLHDTFGHPDSVRAIRRAAPRASVYEMTLPSGHFGLVVGSAANANTWPAVARWVHWREGRSPLPETIVPADAVDVSKTLRPNTTAVAVAQGIELGLGVTRLVLATAKRSAALVRGVAREAPAQLPRLARLEQLDPSTRISLGLLLDEQARREPDAIALVFGDRAHRQADVKNRVDSVVKGLIHIGVRHGDRVGVLMSTRPSAFTLLTAISRVGATAVLLRPDGDVSQEARLGEITWVVSDPEHIELLGRLDGIVEQRPAVLGGGGNWRDLRADVTDMERIEPEQVELPGWYQPDPLQAGDVAFVLFTGEGAGTKALRITNQRWALSALGTASAAALKPGDTILSTTPFHHSSALLMNIGGAVASGARFAMASADDPDTFWDEVRRYGATHVSYTWTSLRAVVDAPPQPNERFHPIRIFMGSGMPRNLWRRMAERFPTARVLEFYASAEGEAILANVAGRVPGSMGRPLPGTAEVRVARFDMHTRRMKLAADGLAQETDVDEIGLLLANARRNELQLSDAMRGVFEAADAWRSTGDLFLRDEQGEHWLAGSVSEIIDTAGGPVLPSGARYMMGTLPSVDLIVGYGVREADEEVLVVAVTRREGAELTSAGLDIALGRLPPVARPRYVQAVPSIPVTTWHRPQVRPLQAEGIPTPSRTRKVWRLATDRTHYEQVT